MSTTDAKYVLLHNGGIGDTGGVVSLRATTNADATQEALAFLSGPESPLRPSSDYADYIEGHCRPTYAAVVIPVSDIDLTALQQALDDKASEMLKQERLASMKRKVEDLVAEIKKLDG